MWCSKHHVLSVLPTVALWALGRHTVVVVLCVTVPTTSMGIHCHWQVIKEFGKPGRLAGTVVGRAQALLLPQGMQ